MSSRQEEKERRRQERLAREQAEASAAARRKRLQLVGGALLGLAAIAAVVVAIVVASGGGEEETAAKTPTKSEDANVTLPKQQTTDLDAAAKAAGCTVLNAKYEGAQHENKDFKASDYKTNPPTSGNHTPDWYEDGIYAAGDTPDLGKTVHPLEHGRIEIQYKPGTPQKTVDQLEALLAENDDGYHMLLFENTTGMKYAVAATAWGHLLGCPEMNDKVYDAIRTFRERYIDKGPETVN